MDRSSARTHHLRANVVLVAATLAATVLMPGCATTEIDRDPADWTARLPSPWATAHPKVASDGETPAAVVFDVYVHPGAMDRGLGAKLDAVAFSLARIPGVVTIDRSIDLSLPPEEAHPPIPREDDTVVLIQRRDPALGRIGQNHFTITIPIRCDEARSALAAGGSIVVFLGATDRSRSDLQGVAFQW